VRRWRPQHDDDDEGDTHSVKPHFASQQSRQLDFRVGFRLRKSLTEHRVCVGPKSGHEADIALGPRRANSGRWPLSHRCTAEVACYSSFQRTCRILFIFSRKRWCHRPACISKPSLGRKRNSARLFHIHWKGTPWNFPAVPSCIWQRPALRHRRCPVSRGRKPIRRGPCVW